MTLSTLLKDQEIGATINCRGVMLYYDGSEDKGMFVIKKRKKELLRTESETNAVKCFKENV